MTTASILRGVSILVIPFLFLSCNGQNASTSSGNKENDEGLLKDFSQVPRTVSSQDTSPGWTQPGQKILLTGIVYQLDGKTPAPGVIIYYYHTNTEGRYVHKPGEKRSMPPNSLGQTHGYIRGWVKTDENGKYSIYTVRPGVYPTRDAPAHIHLTIKEPDFKEYYIDDIIFDDDRLVTAAYRQKMANRAGSGVVRLVQQGDLQVGERNLVLGLNIPDYPVKKTNAILSGKNIGEDVFSFTPFHAWGPDKGTRTCPVCKYGWYHGILYFVGNKPDWKEIKQWLIFLEKESQKREKYLKVYFIYGNETDYHKTNREKELAKLGDELQLQKVALTFVPSFSDRESDIYLNKINPATDNTMILYKRSIIFDKFINMKPGPESFALLSKRLDQTINQYFILPQAKIH